MSKDTSGPAFPCQIHNKGDVVVKGFIGETIEPNEMVFYEGVSIREYAAIKAMQGLLANSHGPIQVNSMGGWSMFNCTESDIAAMSVKLADALLAELEK